MKIFNLNFYVKVNRFTNDLIKILKAHPSRQMFADELPTLFERYYTRVFDIRDYGVCYLDDMLAELSDTAVMRKELNHRTFIQIPRVQQGEEERACTLKLEADVVDMLKHKPRFAIRVSKFIPTYHHHFGRQCKLGNYGFVKLVDLLEAMPKCVQLFAKDGVQFVQLQPDVQLEIICQNLVRVIEENGCMLRIGIQRLEEVYNAKYEAIYYPDFGCGSLFELLKMLPLEANFISLTILPPNDLGKYFFFRF